VRSELWAVRGSSGRANLIWFALDMECLRSIRGYNMVVLFYFAFPLVKWEWSLERVVHT